MRRRGVAVAWPAVASRAAVSRATAWRGGGLACGGLACGGLAYGGLPCGGVACGDLAYGGLARAVASRAVASRAVAWRGGRQVRDGLASVGGPGVMTGPAGRAARFGRQGSGVVRARAIASAWSAGSRCPAASARSAARVNAAT
ncbi:hypothetical protein GCM10009850_094560 [Nonomuraea monospora]|uniref:Uncharacterized protein n=1 Tax=Nonomuraea monospora TaxID=568818 RepID=A0ABN3CX27_9ACTN